MVMEKRGPASTASVPESHDPVPVVAAFDVDKTLTARDCVVPFLLRLTTWRVTPRLLKWTLPFGWAVLRRDRDRVKEVATRIVMTGLDRQTIERVGAAHARTISKSWLRADTVGRLHWHRNQGHHVVLVSASFSVYLQHLARDFECADVLACDVEFDESGRCTGRLLTGNCRGAEKERRLRQWMDMSGLGRAAVYAYGDSRGDAQLLAMATWPTRITRKTIGAAPEPTVRTTDGPTDS